MTRWELFVRQFKNDLKQWLFFMLSLSFFRFVFVVYFREHIGQGTPWTDLAKAFVNGMRYDSVVSTCFIAVPLLVTVLCGLAPLRLRLERVKFFFGSFFIILAALSTIISLEYFKEYNDNFNHFIFNLYYDDTRAILSTVWAEYHVIPNSLAAAVLSLLLLKSYNLFMRHGMLTGPLLNRPLPAALRVPAVLFTIIMILIAIRGSYGHRPVKLEDAAVTSDPFLNKAVLNPFSAGMYAYTAHKKLSRITGGLHSYLPDGDIRKAAREFFNDRRPHATLDDYFLRTARGNQNRRPKHIFLVIMESYDAWPLMRAYSSLALTPELSSLAARGIHVRYFLPASDGTATSFCALVSGLPDANVVMNYQKSSARPYPSSITGAFSRLGYRTRFFYGGYLAWQKIGDFARGQAFDEIYGAAHIGTWASHNEWGVEDENLFDFVVRTVEASASDPSLNIILTTSYHPPYELDVYAKGFPLKKVPDDLARDFDNSVTLKMLGHLWYSDRCVGDFVRVAEKKFEDPLFAFTGDHYGRKFINRRPGQFESSAVPFVLYGSDVLRGVHVPEEPVGSHIDIGPTLIELAAQAGFRYSALGRSMIGKQPNRFGMNRDRIISHDFIFDVRNREFHPLPGKTLPAALPDPDELKLRHDRLNGIAWWRIMRGADF